VQDEWRLMTNADWSLLLLTDFPIWGVLRQAQGRVTSCPAEKNFFRHGMGSLKRVDLVETDLERSGAVRNRLLRSLQKSY
jgi:hypothetical protein